MTAGKGDTQRPFNAEKFNEQFDAIFGVKCKRCGKTGLQPDGAHTCSPQWGSSSIDNDEFRKEQNERTKKARSLLDSIEVKHVPDK